MLKVKFFLTLEVSRQLQVMPIRLEHMVPVTYVQSWLKWIFAPAVLYAICPPDSHAIQVRKCLKTGRMINLLKLVWQTPHLAEWTTTNVLHLHAKLLLLLKTIFPSLATITHGIHMIRFFLEWDIISLIVNYDTVLVLKQCKQNLTKQDIIAEHLMVNLVVEQISL